MEILPLSGNVQVDKFRNRVRDEARTALEKRIAEYNSSALDKEPQLKPVTPMIRMSAGELGGTGDDITTGDVFKSVGVGTVGLVSGIAGLLELSGVADPGKLTTPLNEVAADIVKSMSPEARKDLTRKWLSLDADSVLRNPTSALLQTIQQTPQLAVAFVSSRLGAGLLGGTSTAFRAAVTSAAKKAVLRRAAIGGALGGGVSEGILTAGDYANTMVSDIMAQPNVSDEQKQVLIEQLRNSHSTEEVGLVAAALGMAPGALWGRLSRGIPTPGSTVAGLKGRAIRGATGFAVEGGEEAPQEAYQAYVENREARSSFDPNRPLYKDVGERALAGFVTGGLLGGAVGAIHGVDTDTAAALEAREERERQQQLQANQTPAITPPAGTAPTPPAGPTPPPVEPTSPYQSGMSPLDLGVPPTERVSGIPTPPPTINYVETQRVPWGAGRESGIPQRDYGVWAEHTDSMVNKPGADIGQQAQTAAFLAGNRDIPATDTRAQALKMPQEPVLENRMPYVPPDRTMEEEGRVKLTNYIYGTLYKLYEEERKRQLDAMEKEAPAPAPAAAIPTREQVRDRYARHKAMEKQAMITSLRNFTAKSLIDWYLGHGPDVYGMPKQTKGSPPFLRDLYERVFPNFVREFNATRGFDEHKITADDFDMAFVAAKEDAANQIAQIQQRLQESKKAASTEEKTKRRERGLRRQATLEEQQADMPKSPVRMSQPPVDLRALVDQELYVAHRELVKEQMAVGVPEEEAKKLAYDKLIRDMAAKDAKDARIESLERLKKGVLTWRQVQKERVLQRSAAVHVANKMGIGLGAARRLVNQHANKKGRTSKLQATDPKLASIVDAILSGDTQAVTEGVLKQEEVALQAEEKRIKRNFGEQMELTAEQAALEPEVPDQTLTEEGIPEEVSGEVQDEVISALPSEEEALAAKPAKGEPVRGTQKRLGKKKPPAEANEAAKPAEEVKSTPDAKGAASVTAGTEAGAERTGPAGTVRASSEEREQAGSVRITPIKPGTTERVPFARYADAANPPYKDQRQTVNMLLHRMFDMGMERTNSILGDDPGGGKSAIIVMIAQYFRDVNPKAKVLIVTKNHDSMLAPLAKFMSDGYLSVNPAQFDFGTYANMSKNKKVSYFSKYSRKNPEEKNWILEDKEIEQEYDLVVFDEAHEMRNPASLQAEANEYNIKAKHKLYVTATLADKLGGLNLISSVLGYKSFNEFVSAMGGVVTTEGGTAVSEEDETKSGGNVIVTPASGHTLADVYMNIAKAIQGLIEEYGYVFSVSTVPIELHDIFVQVKDLVDTELTYTANKLVGKKKVPVEKTMNPVSELRRLVALWLKGDNSKTERGMITNAMGALVETAKVRAAFSIIKRELAAGRKVVVFGENYSQNVIADSQTHAARNVGLKDKAIPSALVQLQSMLEKEGIKYVTGWRGGSGSTIEANRKTFQDDGSNVNVMIGTIQAIGTGIDLDDQTGKYPRSAIFLNRPWSYDTYTQAYRRVARRTTKSLARSYVLATPLVPDDHRLTKFVTKEELAKLLRDPYGAQKVGGRAANTYERMITANENTEGDIMVHVGAVDTATGRRINTPGGQAALDILRDLASQGAKTGVTRSGMGYRFVVDPKRWPAIQERLRGLKEWNQEAVRFVEDQPVTVEATSAPVVKPAAPAAASAPSTTTVQPKKQTLKRGTKATEVRPATPAAPVAETKPAPVEEPKPGASLRRGKAAVPPLTPIYGGLREGIVERAPNGNFAIAYDQSGIGLDLGTGYSLEAIYTSGNNKYHVVLVDNKDRGRATHTIYADGTRDFDDTVLARMGKEMSGVVHMFQKSLERINRKTAHDERVAAAEKELLDILGAKSVQIAPVTPDKIVTENFTVFHVTRRSDGQKILVVKFNGEDESLEPVEFTSLPDFKKKEVLAEVNAYAEKLKKQTEKTAVPAGGEIDVVQHAAWKRLGRDLHARIQKAATDGNPITIREALEAIREAIPVRSRIQRRLMEMLIDRVNPQGVVVIGKEGNTSYFDVGTGNVVMSLLTDAQARGRNPYHHFVTTLIHEAVHAVTVDALFSNSAFKAEVARLYDLAIKARPELAKMYGATDLLEFVSETLSNFRFASILDTIPDTNAKPITGKFRTILASLREALYKMLFGIHGVTGVSLRKESPEDYISVLESMIRATDEYASPHPASPNYADAAFYEFMADITRYGGKETSTGERIDSQYWKGRAEVARLKEELRTLMRSWKDEKSDLSNVAPFMDTVSDMTTRFSEQLDRVREQQPVTSLKGFIRSKVMLPFMQLDHIWRDFRHLFNKEDGGNYMEDLQKAVALRSTYVARFNALATKPFAMLRDLFGKHKQKMRDRIGQHYMDTTIEQMWLDAPFDDPGGKNHHLVYLNSKDKETGEWNKRDDDIIALLEAKYNELQAEREALGKIDPEILKTYGTVVKFNTDEFDDTVHQILTNTLRAFTFYRQERLVRPGVHEYAVLSDAEKVALADKILAKKSFSIEDMSAENVSGTFSVLTKNAGQQPGDVAGAKTIERHTDFIDEKGTKQLYDAVKYILARARVKGPYLKAYRSGDNIVEAFRNEESITVESKDINLPKVVEDVKKKFVNKNGEEDKWTTDQKKEYRMRLLKEIRAALRRPLIKQRGRLEILNRGNQFDPIEVSIDEANLESGNHTATLTHREYVFEMLDSEGEAMRVANEYRNDPDGKWNVVAGKRSIFLQVPAKDARSLSILKARILDKIPETNPVLRTAISNALIDLMPQTSIRKAELRRRNRKGYSLDIPRAFAEHSAITGQYKAQLAHGDKVNNALKALTDFHKEEQRRLQQINTTEADKRSMLIGSVVNELQLMNQLHNERYVGNIITDTASNIGALWLLSGPSYWTIQNTQPWIFGLPRLWAMRSARKQLGGKTAKSATSYLASGYAAVTPVGWRRAMQSKFGLGFLNLKNPKLDLALFDILQPGGDFKSLQSRAKLDAEYTNSIMSSSLPNKEGVLDMLERLAELGRLTMGLHTDLHAAATSGNPHGNMVMQWNRIMAQISEMTGRSALAIAAYNMARDTTTLKDETAIHEEAVAAALDVVDDSMFNYSPESRSRYLSGKQPGLGSASRIFFMFWQHPLNVYNLLLRETYSYMRHWDGNTPADKAARAQALRVTLGIFGAHAMVGGLIGATFEPIKLALGLLVGIANSFDDDPDEPWEVIFERWLNETFGNTVGTVLARGLPYSAINVDLGGRINVNNLLTSGSLRYTPLEGRDAFAQALVGILGPMGGIAGNAFEAFRSFAGGDVMRGVEQLSPKILRDVVKAGRMATEGSLTTSGNKARPEEPGPWEIAITAAGFRSAQESTAARRTSLAFRLSAEITKERSNTMEKAKRLRNQGRYTDMYRLILEYNASKPKELRIDAADLARQVKDQRSAERSMRTYGISLPSTQAGYIGPRIEYLK